MPYTLTVNGAFLADCEDVKTAVNYAFNRIGTIPRNARVVLTSPAGNSAVVNLHCGRAFNVSGICEQFLNGSYAVNPKQTPAAVFLPSDKLVERLRAIGTGPIAPVVNDQRMTRRGFALRIVGMLVAAFVVGAAAASYFV